MTLEDETPSSESGQETTGEEKGVITNNSRNNGVARQSRNDAQLCMCLVMRVNFNAVKTNIANEPEMLDT